MTSRHKASHFEILSVTYHQIQCKNNFLLIYETKQKFRFIDLSRAFDFFRISFIVFQPFRAFYTLKTAFFIAILNSENRSSKSCRTLIWMLLGHGHSRKISVIFGIFSARYGQEKSSNDGVIAVVLIIGLSLHGFVN